MVRHRDLLIAEISFKAIDAMMSLPGRETEGGEYVFPLLGVTWIQGPRWSKIGYVQSVKSIALVVNDPKKWLLVKLKYDFLNI